MDEPELFVPNNAILAVAETPQLRDGTTTVVSPPANARLVAFETPDEGKLHLVVGNTERPVDGFCVDRKCRDYHRSDFPQDRPHYHIDGRTIAMLEIKWQVAPKR
jgi:hypothetical protein